MPDLMDLQRLFDALGCIPGLDSFEDLFPGTGIIGRAWRYMSGEGRVNTSLAAVGDGKGNGHGEAKE